jgi:hypothetical protein
MQICADLSQDRPPARPPLHQLSVFPGYLIYIFNTVRSPENFQKKILEQAARLFQKNKEHFLRLYRDCSANVAMGDRLGFIHHR